MAMACATARTAVRTIRAATSISSGGATGARAWQRQQIGRNWRTPCVSCIAALVETARREGPARASRRTQRRRIAAAADQRRRVRMAAGSVGADGRSRSRARRRAARSSGYRARGARRGGALAVQRANARRCLRATLLAVRARSSADRDGARRRQAGTDAHFRPRRPTPALCCRKDIGSPKRRAISRNENSPFAALCRLCYVAHSSSVARSYR